MCSHDGCCLLLGPLPQPFSPYFGKFWLCHYSVSLDCDHCDQQTSNRPQNLRSEIIFVPTLHQVKDFPGSATCCVSAGLSLSLPHKTHIFLSIIYLLYVGDSPTCLFPSWLPLQKLVHFSTLCCLSPHKC